MSSLSRPPNDRTLTNDSIDFSTTEDEHTQTFVDAELGDDVDAFLASEGAGPENDAASQGQPTNSAMASQDHLPLVPQLHVHAQTGELAKLVELLNSGETDANEKDGEGVSGECINQWTLSCSWLPLVRLSNLSSLGSGC